MKFAQARRATAVIAGACFLAALALAGRTPAQDNPFAEKPSSPPATDAKPAAPPAESNPFGDAPASPPAADDKTPPAAPPADDKAAPEPPPSSSPFGSSPPSAAPGAPATPPGAKSMGEFEEQLRKHSALREYQRVLELCEEAEKVYPNEETIKYYRKRAEQRLKEEEARRNSPFKTIKEKPVQFSGSEPVGAAAPAPAPAPAVEPGTPETSAPAETPKAAAVPPPAPPPGPPIEPPPSRRSSGSGLRIVLGGLLGGAGLAMILGLVVVVGKRKKPAIEVSSAGDSLADGGVSASSFQYEPQPISYDAQPEVFGMGSQIPDAGQAFAPTPPPAPIDDDLFTIPSRAPSAPPPPKPSPSLTDSDMFAPPGAGFPSTIGGKSSAPSAPAKSGKGDDSDLFALFEGVYDEPKKSAPVAAAAPAAARAVESAGFESVLSFDFPSPTEAKTSAAPKQETPWKDNEEIESMPALPLEALNTQTAPRQVAAPSKRPWDTDSTKTKTDSNRAPAPPAPSAADDDITSLPLLSDAPPPAFSPRAVQAAATEAFPSAGKGLGNLKDAPPSAPSPAFAEMGLKGIRGPETSETVGAFESISFGGETNPGFDFQSMGKAAADKPLKFGEGDELTLPTLDPPLPAEMPFEQTMRMSARELAEDPDLILSAPHESPPPPGPAGLEKLKVFQADETVQVDLSSSSSNIFGASGAAPKPAPQAAPAPAAAGDAYDQERELGMAAFRNAEWEKAVYHLSIAAALQPDASDIKEHLRRARRMRKEKDA